MRLLERIQGRHGSAAASTWGGIGKRGKEQGGADPGGEGRQFHFFHEVIIAYPGVAEESFLLPCDRQQQDRRR
jgi:hypothetical protein